VDVFRGHSAVLTWVLSTTIGWPGTAAVSENAILVRPTHENADVSFLFTLLHFTYLTAYLIMALPTL